MIRARILSLVILTFLLSISTAQAAVIGRPTNNLGLIGYWGLNEGTGTTVADLSGNRRTGTLINSPAWVNSPRGKAIDFTSASTQYVQISGLLGTPSVATLSAWVNLDGGAPHATAVSIGNYITIHARSFGDVEGAYYRGGAWNYFRAGGDIAGTGWRHIVYVADPGNADQRLYLDGVLIASDTLTDAISWSGLYPNTTIGDNSDVIGQYFLDGRVDEVRIYNRSLTASEINSLYRTSERSVVGVAPNLSSGGALTSGLVGYWPLDAKDVTTNAILDRSGNGNNGGFIGGATTSAKVGGKIGQALRFTDPSHHVRITNDADISPVAAGTVSAWIKDRITRTGGWQVFVSKYNCLTDRDGYALVKQPDNTIQMYLGGASGADGVATLNSYTDKSWHHIVGVWNGSDLYMYVDGALASAPTTQNVTPVTNVMDLTIGSCDAGYEYDGIVDDVRVYNRALTATEVSQLYSFGSQTLNASVTKLQSGSSLTSGLVGHWTFDNLDVTTRVADKSGQGRHGGFEGGSTSSAKVAGKLGQALRFDGNQTYVNVGNTSVPGALTLSAWAKASDLSGCSGGCEIISNYNSSGETGQFELNINNSGDIGFSSGVSAVYAGGYTDSTPIEQANKWYHIVLTRSSTTPRTADTVTIYVDGVSQSLQGGFTTAAPPTGSFGRTSIARNGDYTGLHFPGALDDVRIYNRELTAAEVKQLYNLGK